MPALRRSKADGIHDAKRFGHARGMLTEGEDAESSDRAHGCVPPVGDRRGRRVADQEVAQDAASTACCESEDNETEDIEARARRDQSTGHGENKGPKQVEDDNGLPAQLLRIDGTLRSCPSGSARMARAVLTVARTLLRTPLL